MNETADIPRRLATTWEKDQYLAGNRTFEGAIETEEGLLIPLNPTEASVIEQLTENTGRHLLDSGGAYGRNWERNAHRDFTNEETTVLSVKSGYLEITHNVYGWLSERVEYKADLDDLFNRWASAEAGDVDVLRYGSVEKGHRADQPWLQSAEDFAELLGGGGIYGDGKPFVCNTYNGEDLLSQTLQYVYFTIDADLRLKVTEVEGGVDVEVLEDGQCVLDRCACGGEEDHDAVAVWPSGEYVLLQVHGGCDVRGGYTRARVYETWIDGGDGKSILDNARASLWCPGPEKSEGVQETLDGNTVYELQHRWYSDDGCSWYSDDGLPVPDNDTLVFVDDETEIPTDLEERRGKFWANKDTNTLHCPVCFGVIEADTY